MDKPSEPPRRLSTTSVLPPGAPYAVWVKMSPIIPETAAPPIRAVAPARKRRRERRKSSQLMSLPQMLRAVQHGRDQRHGAPVTEVLATLDRRRGLKVDQYRGGLDQVRARAPAEQGTRHAVDRVIEAHGPLREVVARLLPAHSLRRPP